MIVERIIIAWLLLFYASLSQAQIGIGPKALPAPRAIAAPRDTAFSGVMRVQVDARDTIHKIFRVHQTVPVQAAGPMVLLYPQWEIASHSASASASNFAGLLVNANGHRLEWKRDPVNVFAFHLTVPPGR